MTPLAPHSCSFPAERFVAVSPKISGQHDQVRFLRQPQRHRPDDHRPRHHIRRHAGRTDATLAPAPHLPLGPYPPASR